MIHDIYAYLRVRNSQQALAFYREASGATELFRLSEPSGRVGHMEIDFNGKTLMVSDEFAEYGMTGPQPCEPAPVCLHLHVGIADAVVQKALDADATLEMACTDQFCGERTGVVIEPFGHRWMIGDEIGNPTPQQMQHG